MIDQSRTTTVAAVIPAFNLEACVGAAIRSALEQTSKPDEVIIVDDGSSDATFAVASSFVDGYPSACVLRVPHGGPAIARNAGVAAARSEWIAFLDGDDDWLPAKVERLREAIASHPEAAIVAHDEFEVAVDGSSLHKPLHECFEPGRSLFAQLYRGNFLSTSAIAVRKRLIDEVGGFDVSLPSAQDYDLWLKCAQRGRLHFIAEPLSRYVLRPGSISSRLDLRRACMLRIARRHLRPLKVEVGALSAARAHLRFVAAVEKNYVLDTVRGASRLRALAALPRAAASLTAAAWRCAAG